MYFFENVTISTTLKINFQEIVITFFLKFLCKEKSILAFLYRTIKVMSKQNRKSMDCRSFPNEINCTLTITGSAKEVLRTAIRHAIEEHGHKDTPELRKQLKLLLKNEIEMFKIKKSV